MFQLRPATERGHTRIAWLDSWHTFSFGTYFDAMFMGFSDLRVINDDVVAPAQGFGMHPHDNMEIISVVLKGELEHTDSLGHGEILRPGEVQVMTAGSGIVHSEVNPSQSEPVHFLQIWILTREHGLPPFYEQKAFEKEKMLNRPCLIVSGTGQDDSLTINQDSQIFQTLLEADKTVRFPLDKSRSYWLQVAEGAVTLNGRPLVAGDGVAIAEEDGTVDIRGIDSLSNFLFFNLRGEQQ